MKFISNSRVTLSFLLIWNWNDKFVHTLPWFHWKPSSITDSRQIQAKSIPVFRSKPHPGAAHTYIAYINSSKAGRLQLQLQLQLYSFTFNLQLHDSFHPRIGEPNRGGERDTNLKKEKKKRTILQTVPAVVRPETEVRAASYEVM